MIDRLVAPPLQSELLAPCARRGRRGPGGSGGPASRDAAPTRPSGRGRLPAAVHLWAQQIVGTHSSRKPPRRRNNSIPRPARQHCPSKRCIDTTRPNTPTPDPQDTLWKTPERDSCTSPRRCRPGLLSYSAQQAGASDRSPGVVRGPEDPCSRLLLPAPPYAITPPYAVAAAGPAAAAPLRAASGLLLVRAVVRWVRRDPACRSTSASGATGTIAKSTVTHSALRLSISWMSRTVGARITTMMKAAGAPTTGRLAQPAITI